MKRKHNLRVRNCFSVFGVFVTKKKRHINAFITERQRIKRVSVWKIEAENRHNREKLNRRLKDRETEDWLHYLLHVPCDLGPSSFRTTGWFVQTKEKERLDTSAEVKKKGWDKWRICVILLLELKWDNNDTVIAQQFLPVPLCFSALEHVCAYISGLFSVLTAVVGEKYRPPTVQFTSRCTITPTTLWEHYNSILYV